jgi:hypothetical protein
MLGRRELCRHAAGCGRPSPQNQGFSDRCCGCSWIAPVSCDFRDHERSSSVVVSGYLDTFSGPKVSKRSVIALRVAPGWEDHQARCRGGWRRSGPPVLVITPSPAGPVRRRHSQIMHAGVVGHPVDLAEPDRAAIRGQPSMRPAATSVSSVPGSPCGSPGGDRRDAPPCPPGPGHACGRPSRRSARPARARLAWTGLR